MTVIAFEAMPLRDRIVLMRLHHLRDGDVHIHVTGDVSLRRSAAYAKCKTRQRANSRALR